ALDFRAVGHRVYGISRSQQTCDRAIQNQVVDVAGLHPQILKGVDVVFLCPPIGAIGSAFAVVQPHLSSKTVVTDVGSVKGDIVPTLHAQWPHFIGGHPMAGTAQSGIEAAQSCLFQGRPYVLTPVVNTSATAVETMTSLVHDLGANLHVATPADHDRAVALISHLPIIISAALISACVESNGSAAGLLAQALASSGFRDTSRVGGGNPELGRMVAQFNQSELLRSLDVYERKLQDLRALILDQSWEGLEAQLAATQQSRPSFVETFDQ
ncbi:MAG: prephenate/arogenate dehydrogenase, partial [Cyanobacteria bacterium P01_F01_bin.42]